MKFTIRLKGGIGSGHFGHKGRPGEQGGSLPKGESAYITQQPADKDVQVVLSKITRQWKGYMTIFRQTDLRSEAFDKIISKLLLDGNIEKKESRNNGTWGDIELYRLRPN